MTGWTQVRLVAVRELRERLRSRAFQVATGLTLLAVIAFVVLPQVVRPGPSRWTVAVAQDVPELAENLAAAIPVDGARVEVVPLGETDPALALQRVDAVVTSQAVVVTPDTDRRLVAALLTVEGARRTAIAAAELGLEASDLARLRAAADVPLETIRPAGAPEDGAALAVAFLGVLLLFMAIVSYGQWVLLGVVEEKSGRVAEVVLAAVPASRLLAGKVLGIGLLGLGHLLTVGVVGVTTASLVGVEVPLPAGVWGMVGVVTVWFLLGFALYATAYAAAGALVSRSEDAGNVALPLTLTLVVGYTVASVSLEGDNLALRILSLLPPFAPVTMPQRMAAGTAAPWEIALSFALMVPAIWFMVRGAARVYRGGLLQGGRRLRISQAWRQASDRPRRRR